MLDEILSYKKEEVAARKGAGRLAELKSRIRELSAPRGFQKALGAGGDIHLIAEVKKASPSKGVIRADFDPIAIAKAYEANGATALSVLTDGRFFQGRLDDLTGVRARVRLPVLQKDFILDAFQIYEARAAEADAILLIAAHLDRSQLGDFHAQAEDLGMDVLCEVHSERELEKVVDVARIVGINNRDLRTFETDLETTFRVLKEVPAGRIVVSESGIQTREHVMRLIEAKVNAMLVGEVLMASPDIPEKMGELLGRKR